MINETTTPKLWVGTWGKYNAGNLDGDWFELDDFADEAEFYEAARKRHKDDPDPEFLFNDFEGFPRALYEESYVHEKLFEFVALDDDEKEAVAAFIDAEGTVPDDFSTVTERVARVYDENTTEAEFTEEWLYETETNFPDNKYVIDWEATWNSYLRFDFTRHYDERAGKTWFFWANA